MRRNIIIWLLALCLFVSLVGAADYNLNVHTIGNVHEADGSELYDVDLDGDYDFISCDSVGGIVYWFENDGFEWTRRQIANGLKANVQSSCAGDLNEDNITEVFFTDTDLYIATPDNTTNVSFGNWSKLRLNIDTVGAQSCRVINGELGDTKGVIYTWEGNLASNGGIVLAEYKGGALLNNDSWEIHDIVVHAGAWGTNNNAFFDIEEDGTADDIVFTSRGGHTNPAPDTGLFWAEPNPNNYTASWTVHTIDDSLSWGLHLTVGNFTGDSDKDIMFGTYGGAVYVYDFADDYSRTNIFTGGSPFYTLTAVDMDNNLRDEIFYSSGGTIYIRYWTGSGWGTGFSSSGSYTKSDDDAFAIDMNNDGYLELAWASQDSDKVYYATTAARQQQKVSIDASDNTVSHSFYKDLGDRATSNSSTVNWGGLSWT